MKKSIKKLLSIVFVLVMLVSIFAIDSTAAEKIQITESEPNDSMLHATPINQDCTVSGKIYGNDKDYFVLSFETDRKVYISTTCEYTYLICGIYNVEGKCVSGGLFIYNNQGAPLYIVDDTLPAGLYYFVLFHNSGQTADNDYVFTFETAEGVAHVHSYDNKCDTMCNECGETRYTMHTYDNRCDTTCNECGITREINHSYHITMNENEHYHECAICHEQFHFEAHQYSSPCDRICYVCNYERENIVHTYSNDCDIDCDYCFYKRSDIVHTYSNNCDYTCDVCGKKREDVEHIYSYVCDSTCDVCGEERAVNHDFSKVTTKNATLSNNGYVLTECAICGEEKSKKTIKYAKTFKLSYSEYSYNGKEKKPSVSVKDSSGKSLKKGTDYDVIYASGRKNVGKYKVTIKMKGKYSGAKTLYFEIKPTTKSSLELAVDETYKISAKSNKKITYSSSNKKIAKVDSKGKITAVKKGTATISVKSDGVTSKIKVTVKNPYISISAGKKSIYIGDSLKISAKTVPANAKVTWAVSNKKLASISSSGNLKAKGKGTVTVTAKIKYKGKTYKDTYKVKINVDYPDVSFMIFPMTKYTNVYTFIFTNESKHKVKVLNKGYVYCNGTSERIKYLLTGDGNYYKGVSVAAGKSSVLVANLKNKMLFFESKRVKMEIYIEYRGETFVVSCRSDNSSFESNYKITWVKN